MSPMFEMWHIFPIGLTSLHIVVHPFVGWVVKGERKSITGVHPSKSEQNIDQHAIPVEPYD